MLPKTEFLAFEYVYTKRPQVILPARATPNPRSSRLPSAARTQTSAAVARTPLLLLQATMPLRSGTSRWNQPPLHLQPHLERLKLRAYPTAVSPLRLGPLSSRFTVTQSLSSATLLAIFPIFRRWT
jgi:hypothetical protein